MPPPMVTACSICGSPDPSTFSKSRHPGQSLEERREVLLLVAHRPRGAEHLICDRRGGKGHLELTSHLQREEQILLHHADVEPCFVRLAQHEGPSVTNHR